MQPISLGCRLREGFPRNAIGTQRLALGDVLLFHARQWLPGVLYLLLSFLEAFWQY